jgi:CPA2 family monovalent cation:H+ antiporter-2
MDQIERERYQVTQAIIRSESNWQIVLRAYLLQVIIHSTIIVSIILLSSTYVLPLLNDSKFAHVIACFANFGVISPFFYALSFAQVAIDQVNELLKQRKYRGPIL